MIRCALEFIVFAAMAQADPFCDALTELATTPALPGLSLPDTDMAAKCQTSLMLGGGSQVHCGWSFEYRAPAAQDAFAQTIVAVTNCLGPDTRATPDQDVNHPDFYDLQTFKADERIISVSLKDKGALEQTLVFVRIERP